MGPAKGSPLAWRFQPMRFRLLALDADGSLLDPEGQLRPRVREAVAEARRRSCEVVLCTGRRHRTARGILEALDLDGPAVVQNGVRVVDGPSGRTLRGRYLPEDLYPAVIEVVRRFGPPLVYIDSPQRDIDIVVDDAAGVTIAPRDKALLALLVLWGPHEERFRAWEPVSAVKTDVPSAFEMLPRGAHPLDHVAL